MRRFKEYYELGTKKYTKHTKKMTPGEIYEGPVSQNLGKLDTSVES